MHIITQRISKWYGAAVALLATASAALLPFVAAAQIAKGDASGGVLGGFITDVATFFNNVLIPLIIAIAFLVFIYGVFQYFILGGDDEGKRETGRGLMLYAIVGFVLIVSIWGIVNLLAGGLGLNEDSIDQLPDSPFGN